MKKRILTFLFCLLFVGCFAQVKLSKDFKTMVGTPYKVVDGKSKEYFTDGKGHTISVKTDDEMVTIQKYDVVGMKEISREVYKDFPPINKVQQVLQIGDKIYYVFTSFNKKAKKEDLYSREINVKDGIFLEPKLLFSTGSEVTVSYYQEPMSISWFNLGVPIRFDALKSYDNSKILIRYRTKPVSRRDAVNYDILGFYVFNSNFEKQWGGEVKMPYTEAEMNNLAYAVRKDGTAFMLAYINKSKQFELLNINKDLTVKTNKIDIDGKLYFQEFKLREAADGNITCTGYYANGIDYSVNWTGRGSTSFNTNGILHFKINTEGKVLEKYDYEFPLELINQYESKRAQDKNTKREGDGKAGINDVKMTDLVLNEDGSTTIIGEQQYQRNEYVFGRGNTPIWYYGDVIATKVDKNGKLQWMKKLPKTQIGFQGRGGNGIKYIKGKGAGYILYLDNIKNAAMNISDVPEKHQDGKGGYLTAYKLGDETGSIEKHSIVNIDDIEGKEAFQFKTPRIFGAQDKVFMLEIYLKGKEDTMVKMQLL